MLFYGPPGTGKTSAANAVAAELFGSDLLKSRKLELNASDERGISVVREKIKSFASGSVSSATLPSRAAEGISGTASEGSGQRRKVPAFKLIVLDEADSLTPDAQAALRRTMETYSHVTRFCLICNYVSRIIEPLTSRCAKFRFKPLDDASMQARLRLIAEAESVSLDDPTMDALLASSGGDLRKAIATLQGTAQMHGADGVSAARVLGMSGRLPDAASSRFWDAARGEDVGRVVTVAKELSSLGFAASDVLERLFDDTVGLRDDASSKAKARIAKVLAESHKALLDGADESLQILHVAMSVQRALHDWVIPDEFSMRQL